MEAPCISTGLLSLILFLLAYIGDMLKTTLGQIIKEISDLRTGLVAHERYDDKRFAELTALMANCKHGR